MLYPIELRAQRLAGEQGFEPRYYGPEPHVLPLDDSPVAAFPFSGLKDPAASSGVSQETWMMDTANGGKSDSSERPEAQSPIIQKNWNENDQASGRPIEHLI
jgi:hypothetical protein